ncbi:MAG: hypothetical protein A2915_01445 [Candidatus Yanofskybacteria bacterium RIFCSPLOWO2_01_FULL_41_34]|uniref:Uncharacterized protein n=1 Tax=Candidatus Yanofskybacteria bacterium RIFCSPHIGHO2_01_FULL_41_26 TaxID=1802661 RepID=A0A1F8ED83_9BACT|nr:MAG: hypothetical protein A2649_01920 [Candidatus Yanofskybacteria bacterium RIFCSPHIGHO2_01_FULL_41_26]OGN21894.1 MAG: hypothetical protein A2915_01445 [Candidatus Yanofskybacteria bacterium RIFCSPLOWO2_01_FULL_41_34]
MDKKEAPASGFNPEKTKKQPEESVVDLDSETLKFLESHSNLYFFFPEKELQEIRKFVKTLPSDLQSSARRALIENFKKKLEESKKKSAQVQAEIETFIRNGPTRSIAEIKEELNRIITSTGLSAYYADFMIAVDKFLDARTIVFGVVNKYWSNFKEKWQENLFRDLFGFIPRGRIFVEVLPASIYIKIYDLEDFVSVYLSFPNTTEISARNSGGAKLATPPKNLPELKDKVIIENSALTPPALSGQIKTHEEEHTVFDYYDPALSLGRVPNMVRQTDSLVNKTRGEIDYVKFINILDRWALTWVLNWESLAKDEALAYLKDGRNPYTILDLLKDDKGLYNYFQGHVEEFRNRILRFVRINQIGIKDRVLSTTDISNLAHETLLKGWVSKYKKDLNTALLAVARLFRRYQNSPEDKLKIIRLLSQEPLNKWPRLEKILG